MKDWNEIKTWRRAQRAALVGRREALSAVDRAGLNERITRQLGAAFAFPAGRVVGLCWPYRGEFDARFIARRWREQGAVTVLPEVVGKGEPLVFRKWWPGAPMRAGVFGIPVPEGTERLVPDALLIPMNAFDARGYRIGYGGGFFDRTLAALVPRPLAIGVAFEMLRVPTIHPQAHDLPMDFVVTEAQVYSASSEGLVAVDPAEAGARAQRLVAGRRTASSGEYASPACYAHEFPGYFGGDKEGG